MMKLSQLLPELKIVKDSEIAKIATDSQQLDDNTLWLAARGSKNHALDFYNDKLRYAAIVYEPPHAAAQQTWLPYPNLHDALAPIAARFYGEPAQHLQLIGITGTDGKSSSVHLLAQALDCAMIGTLGYGKLDRLTPNSHTTPDALQLQKILAAIVAAKIKRVAIEVSSHALAQKRVAGLKFAVAIFSNLSRDHLDYHRDLEEYFLTKAQLFANAPQFAIVNIDDDYGKRLITEGFISEKSILYTVSARAANYQCNRANRHFVATNINLKSDGISFKLQLNDASCAIDSNLLARFNVDNLLIVAATLHALGYTLENIANIINKLNGVTGRVERIMLDAQKWAIIDYAHTPAALAAVLQGIRAHIAAKLWLVFGCGGDRDRGKRAMMGEVALQYADEVIISDDNPRHEDPDAIIAEIVANLRSEQLARLQIVRPRQRAIEFALQQLAAGDALLIAGKGHEDYQIVGANKYYFSDQKVVREWIKKITMNR